VAWAWANRSCGNHAGALDGFSAVIARSKNWRLSDILQVIHLAFDPVNIRDADAMAALERIPRRYFLKVANHLIAKQFILRPAADGEAEPPKDEMPRSKRYEDLIIELVREFPYMVFPIQCSIESDGVDETPPPIADVAEKCRHPAFDDAKRLLRLFKAVAVPCPVFLVESATVLQNLVNIYRKDRAAQVGRRFQRMSAWIRRGLATFPAESNNLTRVTQFLTNCPQVSALVTRYEELNTLRKDLGTDPSIAGDPPTSILLSDFYPAEFSYKSGMFARLPMFGHYSDVYIQDLPTHVFPFPSFQRPCRLGLTGTDGVTYRFLLKGNEDLRRDERLMQFFTLLNQMLQSKIRTYSITPLDAFVGVLQWITDAPTFRQLFHIRCPSGLGLDEVLASSKNLAGKSDLEKFQMAQDKAKDYLSQALWIIAQNSERWLLYQSTFAKSLAVMSIVGCVIRLGDRHLGNLLFEKSTGVVAHIDFGLIFGESETRESWPETVPFRATLALGVACGPRGFDGAFRRECERTLGTLGQNEESARSVLQLFMEQPVRGGYQAEPGGATGSLDLEQKKEAKEKVDAVFKSILVTEPPNLVKRLIEQATDPCRLQKMYPGWMAWL
jgi:hypothetical protein